MTYTVSSGTLNSSIPYHTILDSVEWDVYHTIPCCCCLVASLLSCLYQLKAENRTLEERIATMTARRDRLLAVNARLSVPLASPGGNSHVPDLDSQPHSLDNGLVDDATSRHGKSPRSTAAPVQNYTSFRVIFSYFSCKKFKHNKRKTPWFTVCGEDRLE